MTKSLNLAGRILLIGIGLAGLLRVSGCETQQPKTQVQEQTYTPEEIKAWYAYMDKQKKAKEEETRAWYAYMERRNQEIKANSQVLQNTQAQPDPVTEKKDEADDRRRDVFKCDYVRDVVGI